MSGGKFNYKQYEIGMIADSIQSIIDKNGELEEEGDYAWSIYDFSEETIKEFEKGVDLLKRAAIYAQRIDWLVCGDDGEESFHKRLRSELNKLDYGE